jgi:hypothetical protein
VSINDKGFTYVESFKSLNTTLFTFIGLGKKGVFNFVLFCFRQAWGLLNSLRVVTFLHQPPDSWDYRHKHHTPCWLGCLKVNKRTDFILKHGGMSLERIGTKYNQKE